MPATGRGCPFTVAASRRPVIRGKCQLPSVESTSAVGFCETDAMTEPVTTLRRSARRVPAWVAQLGRSGVPEAVTGFAAFIYSVSFPTGPGGRTPLESLVEFGICFFAAVSGRWPRVGTFGVAAMLLLTAIGSNQISTSLFTFLIPLVSNGAHGRTVLRDIAAPLYLVLAIAHTLPTNDNLSDQVQTVIIWIVLVGLAWGTGRTINRLRREGEKQARLRTQALRSQRRSIARDLHDTVSYATTTMVMRAEQIKLRTSHDPELVADLDFIIATGRRSVRDLRGMMEALRRNDPELDLEDDAPWRLVTVHDVIRERQDELAAHGLTLQVSTDADLDSLPGSVRATLAKLIVEATSNMVKHAGRGPCRLIIEVHDNLVEAVFTNPLRPGADLTDSTSGLGIIGASERVRSVGGELEATAASGTWILRVQLPLGE